LVEGLEDVPVGLVRRLERVGKAMEDVAGAEGEEGSLGDGGCAICLEGLLVEADDESEEEDKDKEDNQAPEEQPQPTQTNEMMDISPSEPTPSFSQQQLQTEESSSSPSPSKPSDSQPHYQRIVTLPCAHVFHASCLLPWFSKPKQTTCPICRFNIDPENLTETSRAQRRANARRTQRQRRQQGGEGSEAGQGGDGAEGAEGAPEMAGIDMPLMFGGVGGEHPCMLPFLSCSYHFAY
jgi:collagen type II alpha/collagen type III alpha